MTRLDTISLKKTGEMADLLARRHIRHLPANQSAMPNPSFHRTLRIAPRRPMNSNASAFFASHIYVALHFGPGYRVYFTRSGEVIYLLLLGGDKSSQKRDIKRALEMARVLDKE